MLCMLIAYPLVFVFDAVASGLFYPMVLHLLFLFRLPRDSSTRWSYVWLTPRGSSTRWSYTWVSVLIAPGLFNPMVLHMLCLFRLPRGSSTWWSYTCCFHFWCLCPLPGGLTHTCSCSLELFTPSGLKHIVSNTPRLILPGGLTHALPRYLSTLVLRSTSILSFMFMLIMLNSSYTLLKYFTITFMIMPLTHAIFTTQSLYQILISYIILFSQLKHHINIS